jgi:mRNA-degrading endonuclease toxin of MazEF toxin-antitoxin module
VNRGEIRLIWFPFSRREREPYKKRPVLVMSAIGGGPDRAVLAVMVTANPRRFYRPGPGDIKLADWAGAGLMKPSVIRTRRFWSAEDHDFTGTVLGSVDDTIVKQVAAEIRVHLPT